MNTLMFDTAASTAGPGWRRGMALAALAMGAWAASGLGSQARAGDVYWSVGVHQPGVVVGVSNAPPPRPVIVQPRPVVIHQPPVVVHQPYPYAYGYGRPVVVVPQPVYRAGWGYGPYGHRHHHWKHHDRHDDHRHGGGRDWDDDDDRGGRRGGHR